MKKDIILKVKNLSKNYGDIKALDKISFDVRKGELFSFLGSNGAGKSTTIKILTTLLKQTSGTYTLNNINDDKYIRSKIGVVFQENVLDPLLTIKENLIFHASIIYLDKKDRINKYIEVRDFLEIADIENRKYKTLSGGQKRRAEIARALIGKPEILFLDEPTTGLDPESRKLVWALVKKLQNESNITVFLTTHYMEESEESDYVIIINDGKITACGTPEYLKKKYAKNVLKIRHSKNAQLKNIIGDKIIKSKNNTLTISNIDKDDAIKILNSNKQDITDFEYINGSLNDVFLSVVKKDII